MIPTGPSLWTVMCSNPLFIVVESLAALAAVASGEHHALEQRRRRHDWILELVEHDLGNVIRGVEADEVEEFERTHRVPATELHALVDILFTGEPALVAANRVEQIRNEQPVDDEARRVLREDRFL